MITFSKNAFSNVEKINQNEWLESNELGTFSTSTVTSIHSRKYHGLFNVHLPQLNGNFSLLSKMAVSVKYPDGHYVDCYTNNYPNSYFPAGVELQSKFEQELVPHFEYTLPEGGTLTQELVLHKSKNILLLRYVYNAPKGAPKKVDLFLRPLVNHRNIHWLSVGDNEGNYIAHRGKGKKFNCVLINKKCLPEVYFSSTIDGEFVDESFMQQAVEYRAELGRGERFQEDICSPFGMSFPVKSGEELFISVSIEDVGAALPKMWKEQLAEKKKHFSKFPPNKYPLWPLHREAEKFITQRKKGQFSVIAGFPWFQEWGRDAMISVPGLFFTHGDFERGLSVLEHFASRMRSGVIPNYLSLGSSDTPSYNSVDASFWFVWALQDYVKRTGDWSTLKKRFKKYLDEIISSYLLGRSEVGEVNLNGLIWSGTEETQYTWMDANPGNGPITPRHGYAVEINALWFNALCFYREFYLREKFPEFPDMMTFQLLNEVIAKCKESFLSMFWSDYYGFLADVVRDDLKDFSIKPNQIFAVSLPYSPIGKRLQRSVIRVVHEHLLTPFGLRTLSNADPRYCGHYEGDRVARDNAYHQGTVWPWLIGHFVDAYIKAKGSREEAREFVKSYFKPLYTTHLTHHGVVSIAEIFDGNYPHHPRGCPMQAWSVAEMIRVFDITRKQRHLKKDKK